MHCFMVIIIWSLNIFVHESFRVTKLSDEFFLGDSFSMNSYVDMLPWGNTNRPRDIAWASVVNLLGQKHGLTGETRELPNFWYISYLGICIINTRSWGWWPLIPYEMWKIKIQNSKSLKKTPGEPENCQISGASIT